VKYSSPHSVYIFIIPSIALIYCIWLAITNSHLSKDTGVETPLISTLYAIIAISFWLLISLFWVIL
jgi:hypothetical protein